MKEKKTATMIESHWVMRLRVAVKTSESHHELGRLFLKKKVNAKISIDIPLDYLSCMADVILAMFFKNAIFKIFSS